MLLEPLVGDLCIKLANDHADYDDADWGNNDCDEQQMVEMLDQGRIGTWLRQDVQAGRRPSRQRVYTYI